MVGLDHHAAGLHLGIIEDLLVVVDRTARQVIGFEKLNLSDAKPKHLQVAFETLSA